MMATRNFDSRSVRGYRDLKVWQLGMSLSRQVYELTANFPRHELYGITSQLRRAVTSIPANIAEGHGRSTTKDYLRHLAFALGSLSECETFLLLSVELGYLSSEPADEVLRSFGEEGRMLRSLQRSLRKKVEQQNQKPK